MPRDTRVAFQYYLRGARRGNTIAQANLSLCYRYCSIIHAHLLIAIAGMTIVHCI
jgi:TPR repeat protein